MPEMELAWQNIAVLEPDELEAARLKPAECPCCGYIVTDPDAFGEPRRENCRMYYEGILYYIVDKMRVKCDECGTVFMQRNYRGR